jgi:hypothetical protein
VSLSNFLRRARDATEFTDLGMILKLRMVSDLRKDSLLLIHSWLLTFFIEWSADDADSTDFHRLFSVNPRHPCST